MVSAKVSVYQILEYYQSSMIKRNIGFFALLCKGPYVGNGTKFKMPLEIKPPVICALPEKSAFVLELMKFTIFILLELEAGTLRYTVENLHVH